VRPHWSSNVAPFDAAVDRGGVLHFEATAEYGPATVVGVAAHAHRYG